MKNLSFLSLLDVRDMLRKGDVTASDIVSSCMNRIHDVESKLHAFITVNENAIAEATYLDKNGFNDRMPLWGIPISIKDAIATKGIKTTAASKILEKFVPFYDATAVEKLRNAGAIIIGKVNMDEFAMGSTTENSAYGFTANPRDISCIPGGSSGGSAASVVAYECYASLGSDTGGSIRQPATMCGCVGLKPTYGAVSRYGLLAYGSSLDQIGPLARTVSDTAFVYSIIAGYDKKDETCAKRPPLSLNLVDTVSRADNLKGKTIGLPDEFINADGLDPAVQKTIENAKDIAHDLGANIISVSLPHSTRHAIATYYIIAMAEASSNLSRYDGVRYGHRCSDPKDLFDLYTTSRTEGFGEEVQRRILLGTYVLSAGYYDAYYRKAAQIRTLIKQDYAKKKKKCDFMLAPVSPVPAWKIGGFSGNPLQMYLMDIFTVSLNLAGLPGLSIPMGKSPENLPIGLQIIGREFDEETILCAGRAFENVIPELNLGNI